MNILLFAICEDLSSQGNQQTDPMYIVTCS